MDCARVVVGLVGAGLVASSACADTWTVPSAQTPTLQFALEAPTSPVSDGDTIELTEAGFYLSAYTVSTPNLTIKAALGQNITIDALGIDSVFTIMANNVTLRDLTITGGNAPVDGGAIRVPDGTGHDLTVIDCVFDDNESLVDDGGAIYVSTGSTLTMSGCTLTNNRTLPSTTPNGGAVYAYQATVFIDDCVFMANDSASGGGAAFFNGSVVDITNCRFEGNSAQVGGAIRFVGGGSGVVEDCLIYDNDSDTTGGGVDSNGSWPDFHRCRVIGNRSLGDGGGVYVTGETTENLDMLDCVLAGNTAGGIGGGWAAVTGPDSKLTNCTIVGNTSGTGGGGVDDNGAGAGTAVRNCIIRGNVPNQFPGIPTNVARYCNIEGGAGGAVMIDADPLFVDADGPDDDAMTFLDNDYRLSPGSPSIDAGDSTLLSAEYPVDLNLFPRVVDDPATTDMGIAIFFQTVDQGAHEFQPPAAGPPPACGGADLDGDKDVDVFDFGLFAGQFMCNEN